MPPKDDGATPPPEMEHNDIEITYDNDSIIFKYFRTIQHALMLHTPISKLNQIRSSADMNFAKIIHS